MFQMLGYFKPTVSIFITNLHQYLEEPGNCCHIKNSTWFKKMTFCDDKYLHRLYSQLITFAIQNWNIIAGQSALCFDSDQQGRTSAGCYTFAGEMYRFKAKGKSTFLK